MSQRTCIRVFNYVEGDSVADVEHIPCVFSRNIRTPQCYCVVGDNSLHRCCYMFERRRVWDVSGLCSE